MSRPSVDEESPLLPTEQPKRQRTPLPWGQLSVIMFLQLAEPLTSQVISPFAPELIRNIGVTHGDETKVGHYVGLMHSLFFATQALTVLHWSRLSDHVGRKPVLLIGLFGLSASMYCFGLSRTFAGLVLSRALNGALNGNTGIMKSMMAEICDSTNLAQAYAYVPVAWSIGATLGPFVGGTLSRPADRFPSLFGSFEFFKKYPYFLPCAVPATFSALAWLVTMSYLKETLPNRVSLATLIKSKVSKAFTAKNDDPSTQASHENSPLPLRKVMVPSVLIAAGNYATLALLDITYRTVQPVFFATPIELGGLGLDPPLIGSILGVHGIANGLIQALIFARLIDRFGPKALYTTSMVAAVPLALTFPLLRIMASAYGIDWRVWSLIAIQLSLAVVVGLAFSTVFIFIAAAAPNRASLGATNGIAQMLVSTMRTVGPAAAASMFSFSIETPGRAIYIYYYMSMVVFIALGNSLLLPRRLWT